MKTHEVTPLGQIHPLAKELGPEWRWLRVGHTLTVVILHRGGTYTEVDERFLWEGEEETRNWASLAEALQRAATAGITGKVRPVEHQGTTWYISGEEEE